MKWLTSIADSIYTFLALASTFFPGGMRISNRIKAAVDKGSIPDCGGVTFVSFKEPQAAHYFCAAFNSSPFEFAVSSFSVAGTGTCGSPHILRHVKIPTYNSSDATHRRLAELSQQAHAATAAGDTALVQAIEAEIDQLAKQLWGLSDAELREIQESLTELG